MDRGRRLNTLLIVVALSLGGLIGLVGAVKRESSMRSTARRGAPPEAETWSSGRVELAAPELASEPATPPPTPTVAPEPEERPSATVRVTGLVLLPDGGEAAQARVVLGKQHARADAHGRFDFEAPVSQESSDLVAFSSGYEPALHVGFGASLSAGKTYETRLVLGPPTLQLVGQVRDQDGEPMKHWTVELDGRDVLSDLGLREDVRTDSEGSFRIVDVPAGIHVVRAWKERREFAWYSDPVDAGSEGVRVVVAPEAR